MIKRESVKFEKALLFTVLFATLAFITVGCASAATHYVDSGDSIQAAVDAASPGDTIVVHSGTYYEKVDVNKQLILKGVGMPVVDASDSGSAITLSADGITLDGFTATNSRRNWYAGIRVVTSNDCTITNNNVSYNYYKGIELFFYCYNNTITNNNVSYNNDNGIDLYFYCSNNTITNNNVSYNSYYGTHLYSSCCNNIITDNNVSYNNLEGIRLSSSCNNNTITNNIISNNNRDGIAIDSSSNNVITGNNVSNNSRDGIDIDFSSNNVITNNNVSNNNWGGIYIDFSSNNITITNNNVSNNNDNGIYASSNNVITNNNVHYNNRNGIYSSSNNVITGNNVSNNKYDGIYLAALFLDYYYSRSNNTLISNIISNNDGYGIRLSSSSNNNTITGNIVSNNSRDGIYLYSSSNNKIYLNNFINNTDNGYSYNSTFWNSTEPITYQYNGIDYTDYLGNYWDDYTGSDADGDGIGNVAYSIGGGDSDNYPLMNLFEYYTSMETDWNPWDDDGIITTEEIQEAVYCWVTDTPKNGHTITTVELQELVNMWLTTMSIGVIAFEIIPAATTMDGIVWFNGTTDLATGTIIDFNITTSTGKSINKSRGDWCVKSPVNATVNADTTFNTSWQVNASWIAGNVTPSLTTLTVNASNGTVFLTKTLTVNETLTITTPDIEIATGGEFTVEGTLNRVNGHPVRIVTATPTGTTTNETMATVYNGEWNTTLTATYSMGDLPMGTYTITAMDATAFSGGQVNASASINMTVAPCCCLTLVEPVDGTTYYVNDTVPVSGTSNLDNGTIITVMISRASGPTGWTEFSNASITTRTDATGAWSTAWNTTADATFQTLATKEGDYYVHAYHASGASITHAIHIAETVPVLTVTATPSTLVMNTSTDVTFTVTSDGTAVEGATVTLSGVATGSGTTDANGEVTLSVTATSGGTSTATASKTGYADGTTTLTAACGDGECIGSSDNLLESWCCEDGISTEELQEAVNCWLTDTPKNGHLITTPEMQELVNMWLVT